MNAITKPFKIHIELYWLRTEKLQAVVNPRLT